jgi:tyrosine-protein phosphatase YwqE
MLQIFSKNEYLVDHLEGFIDIHNHILPEIDDGAKNVDESVAMIKAFEELGVKDFICTPHIMSNYYDNTPETVKESYKKLKKKLKDINHKDIQINYAAEHMIDANFESLLENQEFLPLNKEHILIEMSYLQPSINFDKAVGQILDKQLFPVFAHPERYVYLHKDFRKYSEYKQMGLKFQLNALSLFGHYGKSIQKVAHKMLKEDFFDIIGTDAHNLRHINALKAGKLKRNNVYFLNQLINKTIEQFK